MWVHDDKKTQDNKLNWMIQDNRSLLLMNVDKNDSGIYSCFPANVVNDDVKSNVKVVVRSK